MKIVFVLPCSFLLLKQFANISRFYELCKYILRFYVIIMKYNEYQAD